MTIRTKKRHSQIRIPAEIPEKFFEYTNNKQLPQEILDNFFTITLENIINQSLDVFQIVVYKIIYEIKYEKGIVNNVNDIKKCII